MPTSKKRINISLSEELEKSLAYLANRDDVPQATKALYLMQLGMEVDEDDVWNALAKKRDKAGAQFVSHKDAWK